MELAAYSFPIAFLLAACFGALSFLSPCVLPVVPSYLAYMSGVSLEDAKNEHSTRHVVVTAIYFVIGLSTAFLLLAMGYYGLAQTVFADQQLLNLISGAIIIIFGLHFLGVIRIGFLNRELRASAGGGGGALGAYLLGLAFAIGWSPCLGPALGAILSLVANQNTLGQGMVLMLAYALGLGLPFVLSAIFLKRFIQHGSKLRRHIPTIEKIMGGLLVIVGIMMMTGSFTDLAFWLNESFPILQRFG